MPNMQFTRMNSSEMQPLINRCKRLQSASFELSRRSHGFKSRRGRHKITDL
jgi:hypothetical protein